MTNKRIEELKKQCTNPLSGSWEELVLELVKEVERLKQALERSPTRSIMDLKDIMQAKERLAREIKNEHSNEVATGTTWNSKEWRNKYYDLIREIRDINQQLSKL